MSNEQHYDDFDEFFCRDLVPLSDKLTELLTDGNRYHYMLAFRLMQLQANRWLVKPATGFVDAAHEAAFKASWIANKGLPFATGGNSGFINGKVYANLDSDPELEVIADAAQPMCGTVEGSWDKSRDVFEAWHLSGKSIRSAWRVQGIAGKVAAGDRMYAYLLEKAGGDAKKVRTKDIQARYPGWLMDNGSSPTLVLGSLI